MAAISSTSTSVPSSAASVAPKAAEPIVGLDESDDVDVGSVIVDASKELKDDALVKGEVWRYDTRSCKNVKMTNREAKLTIKIKGTDYSRTVPRYQAAICQFIYEVLDVEEPPEFIELPFGTPSSLNDVLDMVVLADGQQFGDGKRFNETKSAEGKTVLTPVDNPQPNPKKPVNCTIEELGKDLIGEKMAEFAKEVILKPTVGNNRMYDFMLLANYLNYSNALHLGAWCVARIMKGVPLEDLPDVLQNLPKGTTAAKLAKGGATGADGVAAAMGAAMAGAATRVGAAPAKAEHKA